MRVEEKAARGEQGDLRASYLAAARLPAQLGDGLAQVARSLGPALGQTAAVRVHRHPAPDRDPVLQRVPVVGQERPGLAGTAEAVALETAQGHDGEAVVGEEQVDVVEPQVALGPQVAGGERLPGGLEPGGQVLLRRRGHAHGRRVDEDWGGGQVAGPLGGGHDERVRAVDRHIHVVQAQRLTDHPAGQVIGHGQRLAQHRVRVGRRVAPVVDRDVAEVFPRGAELRQVTARPGGVARGAVHAPRLGVGVPVAGGGPAVGQPEGGPAPERVRVRATREAADPVDRVVGERHLAGPGPDRVDGGHQVVHDRRRGARPPGDRGQPERGDHSGRVDAAGEQPSADHAVDIGSGQPGVADRRDRRLERHGELGRGAPVPGVRGQADPRDRHLVLGRVA